MLPQLLSCTRQGYGDAVRHIPSVGVVAVEASPLATGRPANHAHSRSVDGRASSEGMKEAHFSRGQSNPHIRLRHVRAQIKADFKRTFRVQRELVRRLTHSVACFPWNVRLITSICCSRVSRTKLTAYPETRIVRLGYFSGWSIASISISRSKTFTFM